MQSALLPLFYLPPISWFAAFLNDGLDITFEQHESFPKQTYRNRAHIYGANGRLPLIVPIRHSGNRQYHETEISYAENWQKIHWKSIKTAYQSTPYFEFYEDRLAALYETEEKNLFAFNLKALQVIQSILKTEKAYSLNQEYLRQPEGLNLRDAFSAKQPSGAEMNTYFQPFSEKMGFLNDLSVIDLICNEGPQSATYLKSVKNIHL